MKNQAITRNVLALALLLPLAAYSSTHPAADNGGAAQAMKAVQQQTSPSAIDADIRDGIDQARQQLLTQDIDVTNVRIMGTNPPASGPRLPKAVITPQGDLRIAGKPIAATPAQHALLLDYRRQLIGIDDAGLGIGESSAANSAVLEAVQAALSGKNDQQINTAIQPQTDKIRAAAVQLCKRMPALRASQQKLAAALPAFRPYARMTPQDVDDCARDIENNGREGFVGLSNWFPSSEH